MEGSACWSISHKDGDMERGQESSDHLFCYHVQIQSLDDLQLSRSLHGKFIFPLLPYPLQLLNVHIMQLVHIRLLWHVCLLHLDWPAHHDIERPSIGHHAHVVIEYTSRMEKGNSKPQYFLYDKLCFVNEWVLLRLHLIIQLVF